MRAWLACASAMLACVRTAAVFGIEACARAGRSRRLVRPAGVSDGRPAGRERAREPRPRAQRDPQLGVRVSAAPRHRQPGAGRHPQGRLVVRSADRARRPRRRRAHHAARHRRRPAARRAVARRRNPDRARRAADRRGGAAASLPRAAAAPSQQQRSRRRRRARALSRAVAGRSGLGAERPGRVPRVAGRGPAGRAATASAASTATSPTSTGRRWRGGRSRLPPPAATTC